MKLNNTYFSLIGEDGVAIGALEQIQRAQAAIDDITDFAPTFGQISESLVDIVDKIEEIAREIRNSREQVNYDPDLQQEVEERLALIESLKRKYGNSVEEIIEYGEKAQLKLDEVTDTEAHLTELSKKKKELDRILYSKASEIHKMRVEASETLKIKVTRELKDLEMPEAEFSVDIRFDESKSYHDDGLDKIEFLISPNPGEGLKPLNKIASGGEMSRIMLAIKRILADVDEIDVLIFDEIDTGVSGRAALKVGKKLLEISANHQVICVTHDAQIASLANAHYKISKESKGRRTLAQVDKLKGADREEEVARLLSGDNSENTSKLAKEMIEKGMELRNKH